MSGRQSASPSSPPRRRHAAGLTVLLSAGFYELSDGGSCSLSTSWTSVYSECLSSSQTSLLLSPTSPAHAHVAPPAQGDVCRRRSADESSAQTNPPRAGGLHLGSSRIRAGTEKARPRPVSAGKPVPPGLTPGGAVRAGWRCCSATRRR